MPHNLTLNERAAEELRAVAARKSITGADMARKLNETPIWISRRMNGRVQLGLDDFVRICDALDASAADVLAAALPAPAVAVAP